MSQASPTNRNDSYRGPFIWFALSRGLTLGATIALQWSFPLTETVTLITMLFMGFHGLGLLEKVSQRAHSYDMDLSTLITLAAGFYIMTCMPLPQQLMLATGYPDLCMLGGTAAMIFSAYLWPKALSHFIFPWQSYLVLAQTIQWALLTSLLPQISNIAHLVATSGFVGLIVACVEVSTLTLYVNRWLKPDTPCQLLPENKGGARRSVRASTYEEEHGHHHAMQCPANVFVKRLCRLNASIPDELNELLAEFTVSLPINEPAALEELDQVDREQVLRDHQTQLTGDQVDQALRNLDLRLTEKQKFQLRSFIRENKTTSAPSPKSPSAYQPTDPSEKPSPGKA